jgi:UDP-N-acetylmuramate dehydrogenase
MKTSGKGFACIYSIVFLVHAFGRHDWRARPPPAQPRRDNLEPMHLIENQPLAPLTTLGIGGPARWFVEARTEAEIEQAVAWSAERGVDLFVLGGGSNLLVSDGGFDGLVLKIGIQGVKVVQDGDGTKFRMGAGVEWEVCVNRAVAANCAGIECLAGIPGTAGGTPVQNVGAYGQEVSSVIDRVRAYDRNERAFVELSAAECNFSYRRSRFNTTDRNRFIVTRADYRLTPDGAPTIRYAELERALALSHPDASQPTLTEVAAAVRRIRQSKGMLIVEGDPDCRSAGSFFKNPVISEELFQEVAACNAAPPTFPAGVGPAGLVKIPAAWLIEHAGFAKGYTLGAAGISSKHTLALINRGGASAADILTLANKISDAVAEKFGVQLEMEPMVVGSAIANR